MTILPLATWFGFFQGVVMFLFATICIVLILLVLIQKGRGGGLVSAFGGMGGNTAFGAKTGDVLTWATSIIFGIFLLLAIILNLMSGGASSPANAAPAPTGGGSSSGAPVRNTTPAGPSMPTQSTPGPARPAEPPLGSTPAAAPTPAPVPAPAPTTVK